MRAIDPSRQARKFLAGVPAKHARQLGEKLAALRADPQPNDAAQLSGQPYWRVGVGEYRVIYRFDDTTLFVVWSASATTMTCTAS